MRGMTVLLADDDRSIRTVLSQALTRIGCRVRATGSANALWRMIDEGEALFLWQVEGLFEQSVDPWPEVRAHRAPLG